MKKALIVLVTVMMTVTLLISCGNDPFFHYVEFDSNGGTAVERQIVRNGEKATEPKDPTKDGTEFVAWYDGENVFDFKTEITKDYKLTAVWADGSGSSSTSHTVTFVLNGGTGTGCEEQTVALGGKATKPTTDPKLTNAIFKFWSADGGKTEFNFDTVITKNTTLTAVWQTTFKVGDTGPAGGIIFFVAPGEQTSTYTDVDGTKHEHKWRYLEAATSDATSVGALTYTWGASSSLRTGSNIGSGWSNQKALEADTTSTYDAAQACADYGNNTDYDDWFLPSKNELNKMYENMASIGTFNSSPYAYWSSSSDNSDKAWGQTFSATSGTQAENDRTSGRGFVRPIRSFSDATTSSGSSSTLSVTAASFVEAYNAADFVINDFVGGVRDFRESSIQTGGKYYLNYWYSATDTSMETDPLMTWDGSKFLNLFTNEAKTKRVGISKFTNYSEFSTDPNGTVNGKATYGYMKVAAENVNLEFKYKDQTSSDNGTTWTDSGAEKTGYLICNASRSKEAVDGSTTKFKYTVTDIKLSVRTVDGSFIDVSSNETVSYKSISYVIDGNDLLTLENLTCDGTALTADETAAAIAAITD